MSLDPRSAAQHTHRASECLRALRCSYVFADLDDTTLAPLAERCRLTPYAPGEHVFFAGDPATALYVLAHGQLKEYVNSADGQERIVEIYGPASVFGDPGLFAVERDRVVNVAAVKPSTVVAIERPDLMPFLYSHPITMERILEGLTAQVRELVQMTSGLAFDRIRDRLALKLVELAETHGTNDPHGTRITLNLSQGLLAATIAATRPNVNRALRELINTGEITVNGDQYIVTNPQRLRAAIAPERPALYRRNRPRHTDR